LALSVPLSRFTPQVGGGSAFFVRRQSVIANNNRSHYLLRMKTKQACWTALPFLAVLTLCLVRLALGHSDTELRVGGGRMVYLRSANTVSSVSIILTNKTSDIPVTKP